MRCPVYHLTMVTAHCLLYQARALGEDPTAGRLKGVYRSKYQPCLSCATGMQVRENGGKGMDGDVQRLKQAHQDILDFSDYLEIRAQIEAAARENFRTLNNEILFRLVRLGNG